MWMIGDEDDSRPCILPMTCEQSSFLPMTVYILVDSQDAKISETGECMHLVMRSDRRLIYKKLVKSEEEARIGLDLADDRHVVLDSAWCKKFCPKVYEHAVELVNWHYAA